MSIHQFGILSGRGDTLVSKTYHTDLPRGCMDMYHRAVHLGANSCGGSDDTEPIFEHESLFKFVHLQRNGLFFISIVDKDAPHLTCDSVLAWISSFTKSVQNFLGSVCEDSVRANIVLIYELLDESVDLNGRFKTTDAKTLASKVYSTPQAIGSSSESSVPSQIISQAADAISTAVSHSGVDLTSFKRTFSSFVSPKTLPAYASHRPIIGDATSEMPTNEVFLDIIENITTLLAPDGTPRKLFVSGNMLLKAFLAWTKPVRLRIQFPDGFMIGKKKKDFAMTISQGLGGIYAPSTACSSEVSLDHAIFNPKVDTTSLPLQKTINVIPGVGEEIIMSYRLGLDSLLQQPGFALPISYKSSIERIRKHHVALKISLNINSIAAKSGAGSVIAMIPIPEELTSVSCTVSFSEAHTSRTFVTRPVGPSNGSGSGNAWDAAATRVSVCDFEREKHRIVLKIPRFNADECATLTIQIDMPSDLSIFQSDAVLSRVGPMRLFFDLPSFTASRLQVKSLKLIDDITGMEVDASGPANDAVTLFANALAQTDTRADGTRSGISGGAGPAARPQLHHYRWVRYLTKGSSYVCELGF